MTSFPYLRISRDRNVPYREVLAYADLLDRGCWDNHPALWKQDTRSAWLLEERRRRHVAYAEAIG